MMHQPHCDIHIIEQLSEQKWRIWVEDPSVHTRCANRKQAPHYTYKWHTHTYTHTRISPVGGGLFCILRTLRPQKLVALTTAAPS